MNRKVYGAVSLFVFIILIFFVSECTQRNQEVKSCQSCYSLFIYPYSGAVIFGDTPVVGVSLHPDEITKVVLSVSSDQISKTFGLEVSKEKRWYFVLKTKDFSDGRYVLKATTYDSSGNTSSDSVEVTIRNSFDLNDVSSILMYIPVFSSFILPQDGQDVFGVFPVVGVSLHPSKITDVKLEIYSENGTKNTYNLRATYVWSFLWNTLDFQEGKNILRIVATDETGLSSSATIRAFVSHTSGITTAINIIPFIYSGGVSFPSGQTVYVTYPIYVTYPFAGTVSVVYPFDGMSLQKTTCNITPYCNVFGFYAMPEQATSVVLLVDDSQVKVGNIFPMNSTFPAIGTFVVSNWWGALSGQKRIKARVFSINSSSIDSQEIKLSIY
ncbi:MAG: hypothetical protein NZ927_04735 [Candidatus Calescibacterium sp.]|nr:hypothetical protein [Candidatus Calescibacterium sp.]MCX7733373.1 hypothetical protein [bacterium]MDW8087485.1 hypothetical protein [Candidatus Calescibacterium sp.]